MIVSSLFQVHELNVEGFTKAQQIASAFDRLLSELAGLCTEGREFAITKTKLEEAAFFAKKSMANIEVNQDRG
jgi:hypothetical protein